MSFMAVLLRNLAYELVDLRMMHNVLAKKFLISMVFAHMFHMKELLVMAPQ